jgi:signal transduction histidine kinase/CheY-like chemotaxis protein
MTSAAPGALETRILLKTSTARDAALAIEVLRREGLDTVACATIGDLGAELRRGAAVLLIVEEVLADPQFGAIAARLAEQPPWSDLPVLLLARTGADSNVVVDAMALMANVTVIERPLRVAALVSTVRSALRARLRQYEMRTLLEGLREADQRKTEFLATLAHELRNPLAPLSTALAMLSQMDVPPDDARGFYQMMERQVDHMVRLIDDLMEVSRITRGKIELRFEPLDLSEIVAGAIELARPQVESAGHSLEIDLPEGDCPLLGDRVRLTQVFANLLNNAAKYTPAGGHVQVVAKCEGDYATVSVRDDGIGVAPEMLSEIFGMFVQVSGAARAAQGGLGIGLTLVKTLVEMHGGRVHAESEGLGTGTEVIVELPVAREIPCRDGGATTSASPAPIPGPVLVVDDNEDAANSLAMYLDAVGATTEVAYDGPQALALVARRRPPVAILDIGMPGMDGLELAQRLRADPANAGMTLIALTGWGQPEDRMRVTDAGFDHHLLKPPDIAQLLALLQGPPTR